MSKVITEKPAKRASIKVPGVSPGKDDLIAELA